jgi:hypothetical protein
MKAIDYEDEMIDIEQDEGFYLNEEELLENDEIDAVSEAFIRGYKAA